MKLTQEGFDSLLKLAMMLIASIIEASKKDGEKPGEGTRGLSLEDALIESQIKEGAKQRVAEEAPESPNNIEPQIKAIAESYGLDISIISPCRLVPLPFFNFALQTWFCITGVVRLNKVGSGFDVGAGTFVPTITNNLEARMFQYRRWQTQGFMDQKAEEKLPEA